jgi:hypothetical protein
MPPEASVFRTFAKQDELGGKLVEVNSKQGGRDVPRLYGTYWDPGKVLGNQGASENAHAEAKCRSQESYEDTGLLINCVQRGAEKRVFLSGETTDMKLVFGPEGEEARV